MDGNGKDLDVIFSEVLQLKVYNKADVSYGCSIAGRLRVYTTGRQPTRQTYIQTDRQTDSWWLFVTSVVRTSSSTNDHH